MKRRDTRNADLVYCSGISGATGARIQRPMKPQDVAVMVRNYFDQRTNIFREPPESSPPLQPGVHIDNLEETGWGVIFHRDADPAVRKALGPLLSLRQSQAKGRYKEYRAKYGSYGYPAISARVERWEREDENKRKKEHKMQLDPLDPDRMPYYLLIVGPPHAPGPDGNDIGIPYSFQYSLDVEYAVGRIYFKTPAEYQRYAKNVVEAETGGRSMNPRVAFFAPELADDDFTTHCSEFLIGPLAFELKGDKWQVDSFTGSKATRSRLTRLFFERDPAALLFVATHGLEYIPADPRLQGSLICQHRRQKGNTPPEAYFAAKDIPGGDHVSPMIAYFFACCSGGTPRMNDFPGMEPEPGELALPDVLTDHSFVADLPQRLLGRSNGLLAVISHVERVWNYTFVGPGIGLFKRQLETLMKGERVGAVMLSLNERYTRLYRELYERLQKKHQSRRSDQRLVTLWATCNDARNFTIIGDPAVRLPITAAQPAERPAGAP